MLVTTVCRCFAGNASLRNQESCENRARPKTGGGDSCSIYSVFMNTEYRLCCCTVDKHILFPKPLYPFPDIWTFVVRGSDELVMHHRLHAV